MRECYQNSEAIARAALELPVQERDDYLSDRCGVDLEKRSRVEIQMMRLNERQLGGGESTRSSSYSNFLRIGQVIGTYDVLKEIGRGGYGIVYKCRERSLGKLVALKMLLQGVDRSRVMDAFIEEGRRLALLNHVNVVQVHCAGMFDGRPYIVMEYLEGRTVRQLLGASSPLTISLALEIASQAARGLHEIHAQRLVHRDISARNLMVTRDQTTKVLDLGLSRFVDTAASTRRGAVAGVPMYLAPEIFKGAPPSFATDIFALGVLTYEMLTGVNPFRGPTMSDIAKKVLHHDPEPVSSLVPGLSPGVARLVGHCLEKDPADRLGDLDALAKRFRRSGEEEESGGSNSGAAPRPLTGPQNPYLNRAMIRRPVDFVGRKREVRRIFARLNANPPASISIVGDRRIGKSSLLNYVSMNVNRDALFRDPDRTIVVFFDLQQGDLTLESFLSTIVSTVRAEVKAKVDVPEVPATLAGLKELVEVLAPEGFRLVVLLDEFERMAHNKGFSLDTYSFLRHLAGHYPVSYVTASVRPVSVLQLLPSNASWTVFPGGGRGTHCRASASRGSPPRSVRRSRRGRTRRLPADLHSDREQRAVRASPGTTRR
jgi:serine/threonine protein kinase